MDQHALTVQLASEDLIHLSLGDFHWPDSPRKAIYCAPRSGVQKRAPAFSHPLDDSSFSSDEGSVLGAADLTRKMSAAEAIAANYRSAHAVKKAVNLSEALPARTRPRTDRPLPATLVNRWSLTPSVDTECGEAKVGDESDESTEEQGSTAPTSAIAERESKSLSSQQSGNALQIIMPESTVSGLEAAAVEARAVGHEAIRDKKPLRCNRLDCQQTLPSSRALKYHIHIHMISESMITCSVCERQYETKRELAMHRCGAASPSATVRRAFKPRSPTISTFRRAVFGNMCCTHDNTLEN